jgi:hypothetical protein
MRFITTFVLLTVAPDWGIPFLLGEIAMAETRECWGSNVELDTAYRISFLGHPH